MSGTNQLLVTANQSGGISNGNIAIVGGGTWNAGAAANQQITLSTGATFSNLSVYINNNISSCTTRYQKGGTNGNQVVTGNILGRVTDTTHSDTASAADLISYSFTTGFDQALEVNMQMNTTTQCALQGSGCYNSSTGTAFQTSNRYTTIMGGGGNISAQSSANLNVQQLVEVGGTASYFGANVNTSTSGTGTLSFNKGGSAGNGTLSIGSGTTGVFVDTTHTDSCSAGDLLCFQYVSTNASGAIYAWSFSYVGTSISAQDLTGSTPATVAASATNYYPIGGTITNSIGQGPSQAYCSYAATASKLRVSWGSGTVTSATMVFQVSNSTGNQSVVYSGSSSTAVDSTHTDSVSATNVIGTAITSASGGLLSSVGIILDDGSVTAGVNQNITAVSATGAVAAFNYTEIDEPFSGVSATGAVASFSVSLPVNSPNLAGVFASGAAGSFSPSSSGMLTLSGVSTTGAVGSFALSPSEPLASVAAVGAARPFVSTLEFLNVPVTVIMNDLPIPVSGTLSASNVPMASSLPAQIPLDCIVTLNPIPISATMTNAPVPGEGSVP